MKRRGKVLLTIAASLLLLVGVVVIGVAAFDWNQAKPWLSRTLSQSFGRNVSIDGNLAVDWRRNRELEGWRSWLPSPHVSIGKVAVGNADWAKAQNFVRADAVVFDLAVLPLLAHRLTIHSISFAAPEANLERLADGRDNWTFPDAGSWKLDIGRINLGDGKFTFIDHSSGTDLSGQVDPLEQSIAYGDLVAQQIRQARSEVVARIGPKGTQHFEKRIERHKEQATREGRQRYAFAWSAQGSYRKTAFKGVGKTGGVYFLRNPEEPFPLQADMHIGDTRIAFVGTLTDPTDLNALDLRMWLAGSDLSQLYKIAPITLPPSPPYAMEGRLVGRFTPGTLMRYEDFVARIGQSDLSGTLQYEAKEPRPLLSGKVESEELQFRDLAPLIGADPREADKSPGKVLPEEPFHPERWRAMDADVLFSGDHVFRDSELPIHKVSTHIVMDNAVLALEPLKFRYAWGNVDSNLRMDGQAAPIKATLSLSARDMQLKHMFPSVEGKEFNLGLANGDAKLTAAGNSVGALLGVADGELKLQLQSGTVSKSLLETMGLNLPNILVTKLFGDKQVTIDCAAADLVAKQGVFDSRAFVVDTDVALIEVDGTVDLGKERVDLVVHPKSKGVRLFSLRSPIHVEGPFAHVETSVDKGALLARAATAIGLGAVAGPAALVPLTSTGTGAESNHCAAALASAQTAPKAPAPTKKR